MFTICFRDIFKLASRTAYIYWVSHKWHTQGPMDHHLLFMTAAEPEHFGNRSYLVWDRSGRVQAHHSSIYEPYFSSVTYTSNSISGLLRRLRTAPACVIPVDARFLFGHRARQWEMSYGFIFFTDYVIYYQVYGVTNRIMFKTSGSLLNVYEICCRPSTTDSTLEGNTNVSEWKAHFLPSKEVAGCSSKKSNIFKYVQVKVPGPQSIDQFILILKLSSFNSVSKYWGLRKWSTTFSADDHSFLWTGVLSCSWIRRLEST